LTALATYFKCEVAQYVTMLPPASLRDSSKHAVAISPLRLRLPKLILRHCTAQRVPRAGRCHPAAKTSPPSRAECPQAPTDEGVRAIRGLVEHMCDHAHHDFFRGIRRQNAILQARVRPESCLASSFWHRALVEMLEVRFRNRCLRSNSADQPARLSRFP